MTFNLKNCSYKPYEKPNDTLLYINKNSNQQPQIIKKLPKAINNRSHRNFSNVEIYQTALINNGYKNVDFKYNQVNKYNNRQNQQKNIIWFNYHLAKQCQQML